MSDKLILNAKCVWWLILLFISAIEYQSIFQRVFFLYLYLLKPIIRVYFLVLKDFLGIFQLILLASKIKLPLFEHGN